MDVNGDMVIVDGSSASEEAVRDNEYAYMYYQNLGGSGKSVETGGKGGISITGDVTVGSVDLINIQSLAYWSATEFTVPPGTGVWAFDFFRVEQVGGNKDGNYGYAWAVHDGDVALIPAPGAALLGMVGLGMVGYVRRWHHRDGS